MYKILYAFLGLAVVACSGESNNESGIIVENQLGKIEFKNFDEKISYCIGLDHAVAAYTVYAAPDMKSKFDMSQIESGMIDYLAGNELRIPFESRDSIFELYLLPNGSVDENAISKVDASYAIGMEEAYVLIASLVGRAIDQTVDVDFLLMGVKDGIKNNTPSVSLVEARTEVATYYSKLNLEDGEYFLAENAKRDSIVTTASGLQYKIFKKGKGITPHLTDSCVVHYTGRFIDGREFESTIPSQRPMQVSPLAVIPGWQEGLLLMQEGGQYRFFLPYQLAYGEQGSGYIEPFSALVFDIELIKVKRFNP